MDAYTVTLTQTVTPAWESSFVAMGQSWDTGSIIWETHTGLMVMAFIMLIWLLHFLRALIDRKRWHG
jgi:hypothetical protein